ncbi:TauD/TfdA family dioxygenase [Actinomadura barringtoniae]|uniref:TauD/TfdA family dioxygenase n=1 Tax=Actinomadura barringtoniae TaxID=1427535 RepID=A0A939PJ03_9ACTN|nr:TauD/TfdA family dioxygenase [Actinomadura barringtoniae]MBO2453290.1 TauD/TfdA family dioxygenase [Actinomadura barringtoniae]
MVPKSKDDASAAAGDALPVAPRVIAVQSEGGTAWVAAHRDMVEAAVHKDGAVVLRGLGVASTADVAKVADALGIGRMAEPERFASRTYHPDGVRSSSQWPADEPMCMHHELSYADEIPGRTLFGCLTAPAEGGDTAVADSRTVLASLPARLVGRFEREGWLLTRMYDEVGVSWTEVFGTKDRAVVEAYCAAALIEHEWLPGSRLLTRQRRAAIVRHPRTGDRVWFNQVAFLNERTLDPIIRHRLIEIYGSSGLPFNTAFGDGGALSDDDVEAINLAYREASVARPWQDGDVLLVDNLRMAHARDPYDGYREVVVVLGDPVRLPEHVLPCPSPRGEGLGLAVPARGA